jgi:hypothetical protein
MFYRSSPFSGILHAVMLSVFLSIVILLNVSMLSVLTLIFIMLSGIMVSVITQSGILQSVDIPRFEASRV